MNVKERREGGSLVSFVVRGEVYTGHLGSSAQNMSSRSIQVLLQEIRVRFSIFV